MAQQPVHTTVCCPWSSLCNRSCQVQDLNHIFSRSMWKSLAWSQRHKLQVHWDLTARHGPDMGQGAVLQHGHAPAIERSGWAWLTGTEHPRRTWWDRGEGWEWRATRWLQAKGCTHIYNNNLGDTALLSVIFIPCNWCQEQGTICQQCLGRWDVKALTWGRCGTFPYANQMLNDEERRERAAVKWRCVWPWHGTHVLAPRGWTRRHLVAPCTAWLQQTASSVSLETPFQECFESEPKGFSRSLSSVSHGDDILPGSLSFYVAAGLGFWTTAKTSECTENKR